MTRPDHRHIFDTEGLQADVMRFMAIIAFCLIAILALVQKLEAPLPVEPTPSVKEEPMPTPVVAEVASQPEMVEPVVTSNVVEALPEEVIVEPIEQPVVTQQNVERSDTDNIKPLVLRFVSDRAFLKLIAEGRIQLYIGYNADFFTLTPAFALNQASPTGQLYELLPDSLPRKIIATVNRERAATSYLVGLPELTQTAIGNLSHQYADSGGAIVIEADGSVFYEN